jgi:hypothetical protein
MGGRALSRVVRLDVETFWEAGYSGLPKMIVGGVRDLQGLRVLTDQWPIILIEFPETRVPDVALRDCLVCVEELLNGARDRVERTYTITDLTKMYEFPPTTQRKHTAEWMSRTISLQKAASLGGATVTRATMLRAFINAIHWIAPPAMPSVFVATRQEAFAEAVKAFDRARMPLRAELRTALAKR